MGSAVLNGKMVNHTAQYLLQKGITNLGILASEDVSNNPAAVH